MVRRPAVAGQFYPSNPKELEKMVTGFLTDVPKEKARGVISPHAGYIYSGHVAGALFSSVEVPDNIILIGPNHTGFGETVSVMESGSWEIPLGRVLINEELAGHVTRSSRVYAPDAAAHLKEHSLEVQLPFLYLLNRHVTIVPITVMHMGLNGCLEAGRALAGAVKSYGKEVLIVVSSDMNHYEPDKRTRDKDKLAIEKAIELDAKGLLEVTASKDITMCGVVPAAIAITALKELGARNARVVKYATSGETSEDFSRVVGYAGIVFK